MKQNNLTFRCVITHHKWITSWTTVRVYELDEPHKCGQPSHEYAFDNFDVSELIVERLSNLSSTTILSQEDSYTSFDAIGKEFLNELDSIKRLCTL